MAKLTDKCFRDAAALTLLVHRENLWQIQKWGIQNHEPSEWLMFLTEEVGELAEAIAENQYRDGAKDEVVKEAIQVATLALKIAEMYGARYIEGNAE